MIDWINSLYTNPPQFYTVVLLATGYLVYLFVALRSHMRQATMVFDWNKTLRVPQKYRYSWKGVEITPVPGPVPVEDSHVNALEGTKK